MQPGKMLEGSSGSATATAVQPRTNRIDQAEDAAEAEMPTGQPWVP